MKLKKLTERKWNYPVLAFFMVCGGLLVLRLISALSFSGEYSMLYSDCYHQYYPFFVDFRKALLSGDSLLYNWSLGMGMDYLGLISYYLASPLNLLSVLVPEGLTLEYFSLLMPLKLGFAAMFFALFLKKVFRTNDFSVTVFGCFYALCAWALGYQWNIMWLDTFALLPLVIMGMISLLSEKKFMLYTITLFLSVACNYYIGFFTCIFVLLSFICYQICCWSSFKKFMLDLVRIALFSALAIAMTAFLTLPTLSALQNTQSSVNTFPTGFRLNIADKNTWLGLLDAMRQVASNMNGALEPTFKEGLPNIYCGIAANVFAFLFFTCCQVKLREKLCSGFLLLFINLSFILRQLDYIWHGFHFTNMIPYRFSFLYSFVLLYMAYKAWTLREHFRPKQIALCGTLSVILVFCSEKFADCLDLMTGNVVLKAGDVSGNLQLIASHVTFTVYNLIFIALYLSFLIYACPRTALPKKARWKEKLKQEEANHSKRRLASTLLLCVMIAELGLNLVNFGSYFPGTNVADYPKGTVNSDRAVRYMQEREKYSLFYRAEMTHSQTLNDGALNGYNGISTFTSSANVKVTEFMRALGYGAKNTYNRYCFEESSPVANLFLNLKYMIERDGKVESNAYFDDVHYFGNVHLLENNAYLPLGFCVNEALADLNFSDVAAFDLQNRIMSAATGIEDNVWSYVNGTNLSITATNVTITSSQTQTGYCAYNAENAGYVKYNFTADKAGLMCIMVNQSKRNNISIFYNGNFLYSETYSLPQMLSVCQVEPGDVVEVRLKCTSGEKGTIDVDCAILDEVIFRQGYDVLNSATLNLTSFENTYVEGTVSCDRDTILYTSIPQDGNWTATVDGKRAQIVLIGDVMVGVRLTEGTHTVSFTYHNRAFSLGWKISLLSFALLFAAYYIVYRPDFKKFLKKK